MSKISAILPKLCISVLLLLSSTPAKAQITPDGTLGAERSVVTPNSLVNGKNADLITGGAQRGSNLFHSFSDFNVNAGQSVYFANPSQVTNILTRVTGGNPSNILGTLGVNGTANLFLINPAGILFGSGATLDLKGSFVGTTANAVQFGNLGSFSATNPQAPPPLLTIDPSALLFNQLHQGATITNQSLGGAGVDLTGASVTGLRVPDGKSLLLVGGDVVLDGGNLNALGGRVELGGLASPGTVELQSNNGNDLSLSFPGNVQRGDVSLSNGASVRVDSNGGGNIVINANNINITGSSTLIGGIGQGLGNVGTQAGDITLNAIGDIKLDGHGNDISNNVQPQAIGNGGNINLSSNSFSLTGIALLEARTFGQGNAGNVIINATKSVTIDSGQTNINNTSSSIGIRSTVGQFNSNQNAFAKGNGGNIEITTEQFSLTNSAELQTATFGQGNAGNIIINATNNVSVDNQAIITSTAGTVNDNQINLVKGNGGNIEITTGQFSLSNGAQLAASTFGQGNAGNVIINATKSVSLDGSESDIFSAVGDAGNNQNSLAIGNGGNIEITTGQFSLSNGAQLLASTFGQGNAGNVIINATKSVSLDGSESDIFSTVGDVNNNQNNIVRGNGGNIQITTDQLSVTNGAQLVASTFGQGNGGNITLNVLSRINFDGKDNANDYSGAFTDVASGGVGKAGDIQVTTGALSLTNGAVLASSVSGQGTGGNITINASNAVSFDGSSSAFTDVFQGSVGNAGNIKVTTGSLSLTNGSQLSATVSGQGNAGNITIDARDTVNLDGANTVNLDGVVGTAISGLQSELLTGGVGKAGNIQITTGSLSVTNSAEISSSSNGQGNAGDITLNARDTITFEGVGDKSLPGGNASTFLASNGVGNAGNISVSARALFLKNGGQLNAESFGQGNAGNITINTADTVVIDGVGINGNNSGVQTFGISNSNAGDIQLTTGTLSLTNGGELFSTSEANAGNITVNARDAIIIDGVGSNGRPSWIESSLLSGGVGGKGGDIQLKTNSLTVSNGAALASFTAGQGNAGNINVTTGSFSLTNGSELLSTTIGRGNGGNITINARDSVKFDGAGGSQNGTGAYTTVDSGGVGNAGNINLTAGSLSLNNGAQLVTSTVSGNGGNIQLTTRDYILLRNGSLISTNAGTAQKPGNGGNIIINSPFIVAVPNENNDITANAFSGSGGQININAQLFGIEPRQQLLSPTNDITAFSQQGVQGQIVTTQPQVDLVSGLVAPPIQLADVTSKFSQLCPNTVNPKKKPLGSFVITGKGSIPPNPLQLLPGRNPDIPLANAEDMQEIKAIQAQDQKKKEEQEYNRKVGRKKNKDNTLPSIVEAQGIVQTPDGQIYFVANANHATPSSQPTASPCPGQK